MEHKESCRTMSTGEFHGDPTKAWKDPTKNHECKTVERKKCIQYSNGLIYRNKNLGLFVNENFEILLMKELRNIQIVHSSKKLKIFNFYKEGRWKTWCTD